MTLTPEIGLTLGDPLGIGPEIIARSLRHSAIQKLPVRFRIFSARKTFLGLLQGGPFEPGKLQINFSTVSQKLEKETLSLKHTSQSGHSSVTGGKFSYEALKMATDFALNHRLQALVTAPISKLSLNMAGSRFKGHTDFFSQYTKKDLCMFFHSPEMNLILVTDHVPLRKVSSYISKRKLHQTLSLGIHAMKQLGHTRISLHVLGLNPHAGEMGVIGREEADVIQPFLDSCKPEKGIRVEGPHAADSFFASHAFKSNDLIVAMHHDQGLIPFKWISKRRGVHITLGLPFVRTTPDHGTAFDIAGKNIANPSSCIQAILTAFKLISRHSLP